ncbi:HAMP domain-containing protein [Pseudomonas sp. SZ57]|uniref:methyl-accepting chemotaxis protein n=1 Tax=Pseudomonas sp. SZ57 TaxID=2662259 RepID=UPI00129132B0|nr:methyl-accepting chemotaxis protein [Pseudomonas sp. SZ57]MQQ34676.1 HAMP domain-containing protein [Pseudomonas sp. SZ57]
MSNIVSAFLSNLKVKNKLLLGFSSLIGMIILMAYTGWQSTQILEERSERNRDVSKLSTDARNMRIERLNYAIKPDEVQARKWLTALEHTELQLKSIKSNFDSPPNLAFLNDAEAVMGRYRAYYDQTVAATKDREAQIRNAASLAEAANETISKVADAANSDGGSLEVRKKVTSLFLGVQKMRVSFRVYFASPGKDTEEAVRQAVGVVIEQANSFKTTNVPENDTRNLIATFSDYKQRLESIVGAQTRVDEAQAGITASIAALLNITDQMDTIQNNLRTLDARDAQKKIALWLFISILAGILSAWFITHLIVQPLKQTVLIVEQIAAGDFTYQTTVVRRDELGILQGGMVQMASSLRTLIGAIKDGVVQVASAAEELSAVTEQTSVGVHSQKLETDHIATAMQEMTATTQDVAQNAARAVSNAQNASRLAIQGGQIVDETRSQIESLAYDMDTTKKSMEELRANTQSIGSVLDVIKTVADQTNLLALNAAIEAARAGEAGRGFAVVADEVRGLAVRTRTSTDDIALLISQLQESTDKMTQVLEHNLHQSHKSAELSRNASQMLLTVNASVQEIEAMNEQIAVATEEQSSVGEEISRGIINVREISDQTAAASEETATSSIELARVSAQLQEMTNNFKV